MFGRVVVTSTHFFAVPRNVPLHGRRDNSERVLLTSRQQRGHGLRATGDEHGLSVFFGLLPQF